MKIYRVVVIDPTSYLPHGDIRYWLTLRSAKNCLRQMKLQQKRYPSLYRREMKIEVAEVEWTDLDA